MRMRMFLQTHYKGILAANTRAQADVNKCKYISLGKWAQKSFRQKL